MARRQAVLVVDRPGIAGGTAARWVDAGQVLPEEEARLAALVARGLSNAEIGRQCHLAPDTVHHRVARLCEKLCLRNRVELAAWAGAHGLWPCATIDPLEPARRTPPTGGAQRRGPPDE